MLKISNVKVPLGQTDFRKVVSQELNVRQQILYNVKLDKQSIDARRKVCWICNFVFEVDDEENFLKQHPKVQKYIPYQYEYPQKDSQHVVIVGCGPAGLFCGYVLSQIGQKVTIIERGQKVEERVKAVDELMANGQLNPQSNIAFGEGGAGTFSDGKLTTGIKNKRLRYVLETFVKHGAPEDILYLSKPHIGTDYLRKVLISMRQEMIRNGVEFMFETQLIDFYDSCHEKVAVLDCRGNKKELFCDALVLAIGHSARDTYEMLYQKNIPMEQKAFAVGVRIEQLQSRINEIQYKQSAFSPYLKAAPYKLAVKTSQQRGVYTFCMCPGGYVVPSMHEPQTLCVNGMSYYARGGKNANSAILVNVKTEDFQSHHPLAGIEFQRNLEHNAYVLGGSNGYAPVQLVEDYYQDVETVALKQVQPTYQPGYTLANLNKIFPDFINQSLKEGLKLMNKKMPGFIDENTIITGVEARSSAPLRLVRNDKFESLPNIYSIGEGAGYAGGIMSAAVDGILCAEHILEGESHGSKGHI